LPLHFEGRLFAVDENVAEAWGKMVSRNVALGRPMGVMDAFLSATAEVHRLTLVTRNVSDFPTLKTIVNPWS
jgi:toxin FitB